MGLPVVFQRIESAFVLSAALFFYFWLDFNLLPLILLVLVVDVFMIGYVKGNRVGAIVYNLGHNYAIPTVLLVSGIAFGKNILIGAGLIWAAHIALDRLAGYGLKSDKGFKHTHLGKIG